MFLFHLSSTLGGAGNPAEMETAEGSRDMLGLGLGGCVFGGPTGTIRDPNSTPIVTS